jgi:hypothetical protein
LVTFEMYRLAGNVGNAIWLCSCSCTIAMIHVMTIG